MKNPTTQSEQSMKEYGDLWLFNLQKITGIHKGIETALQRLEKLYSEFEISYGEVDQLITLLAGIYSSINSIDGGKHALRLKAVLEQYRARYTREGIDFNLIDYLMLKIADSIEASFKDFPAIKHYTNKEFLPARDQDTNIRFIDERPFKWVTFERNGSSFIAPYQDIEIKLSRSDESLSIINRNNYILRDLDSTYTVRDFFTHSSEDREGIHYFILLDGKKRNFAAAKMGKRIFARQDIISPEIRPFTTPIHNNLSPGRVHIFGKNHLYLN